MPLRRKISTALLLAMLSATSVRAGTLVIESWRVDDKTLWEKVLIPAFEKNHPGIEVKFAPTAPTEYDSSLAARLAGGTAGDLIACRPFDVSLALYKKGHLEKLDGKAGMQTSGKTVEGGRRHRTIRAAAALPGRDRCPRNNAKLPRRRRRAPTARMTTKARTSRRTPTRPRR